MWQFAAIGTQWSIETPVVISDEVKALIADKIDQFDKTYSRFRDDSLVVSAAHQPGTYVFPVDSIELVDMYQKLYAATDGAVTPLVGDALVSMGYDKDYTLQPKDVSAVPRWDDSIEWQGSILTTRRPVTLDFGAVGKGYLVDIIAAILESHGFDTYTIDASGDVRHHDSVPQVIGLENPHDTSRVIGTMTIQNASLCASATNRRRWANGLHHVIDGRTSKPTNEIVATWVVAASTAVADGIATALFFVDAERLREWDFQFVRLYANGKIEHSEDFVGELFI